MNAIPEGFQVSPCIGPLGHVLLVLQWVGMNSLTTRISDYSLQRAVDVAWSDKQAPCMTPAASNLHPRFKKLQFRSNACELRLCNALYLCLTLTLKLRAGQKPSRRRKPPHSFRS